MPALKGAGKAAESVEAAAASVTEMVLRRLDSSARLRAIKSLGPILAAARRDLKARLSRAGAGADSFTSLQAQSFRAQIAAVVEQLSRELGVGITQLMHGAKNESAHLIVQQINSMQSRLGITEVTYGVLPVVEVSRLAGVLGAQTSLLETFRQRGNKSALSYGTQMVQSFERSLAEGLATGLSTNKMADRLVSLNHGFKGAWWRAERIARTEVAWAFNRSHQESSKVLADDMGDVLNRWVEHVDDDSLAPLDDRVAADSIALHGQLRLPGDAFYDSVHNKYISEPPNRPNDRATLVAWRASWGEPPGGISRLDAGSKQAWAVALKAVPKEAEKT